MADYLDRLLYSIEIDGRRLRSDARLAENAIYSLGDVATKTFQQQIGRELGKALDPKTPKSQLAKINKDLAKFGTTAQKTFQQTFGRRQAQDLFKPFVDETKTFTGRITSAFKEAFDIKKIAVGAAAGLGLAALGRSLGNAAKAAIEFAADFDFALAKVRSIAGEKFNLNVVTKDLERIATTVPQDLNTLTEALFFTITSGIRDVGDATRVLEIGAKAAVAGVTDATVSIDALTTIVNAYNADASDARHISDILFRTVDQGKVFFDDLSKSIGDVASPASLLNASFEDVSAAIATMTKAGINVEETTTAIRNFLLQIANANPKAKAAAASIGIDLSEAGLKAAGGFRPFVAQIAQATKGNTQLLAQIAGNRRAFRALAIIAGVSADEFQRLAGAFNDVEFTAGASERAFQILNKTARNQYKLFKDSLLVAVKDFGDAVINISVPALVELTELLSNDDPINKYIKRMNELGASIKQLDQANASLAFLTAKEQIAEINEEFKDFESSNNKLADFLRGQGIDVGWLAVFNSVFQEAKNFTSELIKQTATVEGLTKAQDLQLEILDRSRERLVTMSLLRTKEGEFAEQNLARLEKEQETDDARLAIIGEIVGKRLLEVEAQKALGQVSEKDLKALEEQKKKLEEIERIAGTITNEAAKTKEEREAELDAIDKLRESLADAQVGSQIVKKIQDIQKEAEKTKAQFEGVPEAVALATKIAATQIDKLLSDTYKKVKKFNLDLRRTAEKTEFKLSADQVKFDPIKTENLDIDFSGRVRLKVDSIFKPLVEAVTEFSDQMEIAGFALDDSFAEFVGNLDSNAGKIASNLVKISKAIDDFAKGQGSVFSILAPAVGFVKGLFTGDDLTKQAEARRRSEERAADAVRNFTRAIEELQDTLNQTSLSNLELQIAQFTDQIQAKIESGVLTAEQIGQIATVASELAAALGRAPTSSEIDEALRQRGRLDEAFRGLSSLFRDAINDKGRRGVDYLSEELKLFFVQLGISIDELENFGKQQKNTFRDIIDNLRLQFDILDISDPTTQLQYFADAMAGLGISLPTTTDELEQFARDAFDALTNPATDLADFLRAYGLEDLGKEEFKLFLQTLEGFLDDIGSAIDDAGGNISKSFSDVLAQLGLEFELFDTTDPIEKLKRLQDELAKFGAQNLPATVTGIEDFVRAAFKALTDPAIDLAAFLQSYGLENLGRDEFENFLRTIEQFVDDINAQAENIDEVAPTEIAKSFVQTITIGQANTIIDELGTIRIIFTRLFDVVNTALGGGLSGITFENDGAGAAATLDSLGRLATSSGELLSETKAFSSEIFNQSADIAKCVVSLAEIAAGIVGLSADIQALSPTGASAGSAEIVDRLDSLRANTQAGAQTIETAIYSAAGSLASDLVSAINSISRSGGSDSSDKIVPELNEITSAIDESAGDQSRLLDAIISAIDATRAAVQSSNIEAAQASTNQLGTAFSDILAALSSIDVSPGAENSDLLVSAISALQAALRGDNRAATQSLLDALALNSVRVSSAITSAFDAGTNSSPAILLPSLDEIKTATISAGDGTKIEIVGALYSAAADLRTAIVEIAESQGTEQLVKILSELAAINAGLGAIPAALQNSSVDEAFAGILAGLPEDLAASSGRFLDDLTATVIEKFNTNVQAISALGGEIEQGLDGIVAAFEKSIDFTELSADFANTAQTIVAALSQTESIAAIQSQTAELKSTVAELIGPALTQVSILDLLPGGLERIAGEITAGNLSGLAQLAAARTIGDQLVGTINELTAIRQAGAVQLEFAAGATTQRAAMVEHLASINRRMETLILTVGNGVYREATGGGQFDTRDINIISRSLGG